MDEFVYQEKSNETGLHLQYINTEEGRIRVMTPTMQNNGYDVLTIDATLALPDGKKGVWDYYLRDYQEMCG